MAEEIKKEEEVQEETVKEETVEETVESEDKKEPSKKEKKDKLSKKISELELENAELKEKLLRNSAELANFKKRLTDEKIQDRKYASMDLVGNLVAQLENLRLVCNMPTEDAMLKNFLIGFKMINDQLFDILTRDGLKEINTKNQKFDPKIHKAIEVVINNDIEENICVEEVQKGYMYKDRVLRCANVKVSKKSEENKEKGDN